MTESMVEKVARAIYTEFIPAIERFEGSTKKKWDDLDPDEDAIYLACWMQMARAAMKAMLEPTRNMRGAAVKAKVPPGGFTRGYQAMIDAALAEKDKADA